MFADVADQLAEVEVEGERLYVRAEDLDDILAAEPTTAVRLLGGFDQWVLGPGTSDSRILAARRRSAVSRQSGWIAPIVVVGGVIAGTWDLDGDLVRCGVLRGRQAAEQGPQSRSGAARWPSHGSSCGWRPPSREFLAAGRSRPPLQP